MSDCKCTTAEAFPQPSGFGWTGQYSPNQGWESNRYSFRHGRTSPSPFFPMATPAPEFNNQVVPTFQDVANALTTNEVYPMFDEIDDGQQLGQVTEAQCRRQGLTVSPDGQTCVDPAGGIVTLSPAEPTEYKGLFWGLLAGVAIGALLFKR